MREGERGESCCFSSFLFEIRRELGEGGKGGGRRGESF